MTSTMAKACAEALFSVWVSRFGVPAVITSDRGPQFSSSVWSALCLLLGVQPRMTTAYRSQANGLVERFHRWGFVSIFTFLLLFCQVFVTFFSSFSPHLGGGGLCNNLYLSKICLDKEKEYKYLCQCFCLRFNKSNESILVINEFSTRLPH